MIQKRKANYFLIGFFCLILSSGYTQNQGVADSLSEIYIKHSLEDVDELELLKNLAFNEVRNLQLGLEYSNELIRLAKLQGNKFYLHSGYFQQGNKHVDLGNLNEALNSFMNGMKYAIEANYQNGEGNSYCAIADIYAEMGNHINAVQYYYKGIAILRQSGDSVMLATTILNAGDEFLSQGNYDSALHYFEESGVIFNKKKHLIGMAYNLGNTGMVYANTGNHELAEKNINEAIAILEQSEDYYPICFYLIAMSDIYEEKGDLGSAMTYAARSLELAEQHELKQQISDANLKLSELYEAMGKTHKSLDHYKSHIAFRDSVNNLETVQKIADQRTEFEVNLREKEINLLEQSQLLDRIYIAVAVIMLILSVVVLLYFRQRFRTARLVAASERKEHDEKIKDLLSGQETKALQAMVQGQEDERKRLAQELHNHFGSLLATIKVNVNGIDENAISNHGTLSTLVDQACSDIRNMSHALNMGISEDFGLVPALKELTTHLRESGGIAVEFSASMGNGQLESESEILTYRIVQELLSNALKHAEATKLSVMLTCFDEDHLINIMVEDNGKGFDPNKTRSTSQGMGLSSLKQMVADMDGEINFDSTPARGTTVTIDLPISTKSNLI